MIEHVLRYGTNADQVYFSDLGDCYDSVAINASMAAFSPDALSVFVTKKTTSKRFFIDPMTHLFQHNKSLISSNKRIINKETKETAIKKSISKLIDKYAENVEGYSGEKTDGNNNYNLLREKIFHRNVDDAFWSQLTKGVLDFQLNLAGDKTEEYSEYIDYANKNSGEEDKIIIYNEPSFLVAPYFYLKADDEWLEKNKALVDQAIKIRGSKQIFAQIVVSKGLYDRSAYETDPSELVFTKIIADYSALNLPGYLVWIDDFVEHKEYSRSLEYYAKSLKSLKEGKGNVKVYSLYGGYFSTLLGHDEISILDGVSHGLEYGESRPVVPVGGGIPRAKFYLPKLHKRVDFADMIFFLQEKGIDTKEKFRSEVCDCDVCMSVIKNNVLDDFSNSFGMTKSTTIKRGDSIVTLSFSTKETKDLSLRHYLHSKKKEFLTLNDKSVREMAEEMEATALDYEKYLDGSYTSHLNEWSSAIRKLISP